MENPFKLTEEQLKEILAGYKEWLSTNPDQTNYAQEFKTRMETIRAEFLSLQALNRYSDDDLFKKIFDYSRTLEGPAFIKLGEQRIKENSNNLRRAFNFIISSKESPFEIAQNILEGDHKIEVFAKAFWSPILQARFPDVLPNWNNKTENFLRKVGVNITSSKFSIEEKYRALSDAFKYFIALDPEQDFFTINHLMHYGTVIKEGVDLISSFFPEQTDPIADMIERYKSKIKHTKLSDEIYKWQLTKKFHRRPDVTAENFEDEYSSIDYSNLIYHNAKGVGNHIANERTEKFREQFRNLFDESVNLQSRITKFNKETLAIYREIWTKETDSHHQDERTISTYLAYFDANRYPLYKDSFYRKYCELTGVKHKSKGEKYVHYIQLLEALIEGYISVDEELLGMKKLFLPDDAHEDLSHFILAQDILYQMLDKKVFGERNYWRMGTTSNNGESFWEKMKMEHYVAIGWPKIGDLSDKEIENKKDVISLMSEADYHSDNKSTQSKQAGQLFAFFNDVAIGDVVVAQEGQRVLGIGIVNSDYMFLQNEDFPHSRGVNWEVLEPKDVNNQIGLNTTVFKLEDPHFLRKIDLIISTNKTKMNLNTILYGPPGTGKTFNTVDIAVQIAAPDSHVQNNHESNKKTFDRLIKEGQIVFTTFHQSMCYEDFIEGIKPLVPIKDGNPVVYKVDDGIFKQLCKSALTLTSTTFELSYNNLLQELNDSEEGFELLVKGNETIRITSHPNGVDLAVESKSNISSITKSGLKYVSDSQRYAGIWGKYYKAIFKLMAEKYGYEFDKKDRNKNYVIIIDEINRGNVSEIFGELITLIEEDKRLGNAEAMEIVLPYSKQKFGVPSNIYILGTMNTADRSIEALDTALRRRFSFIEMMPFYGLKDLEFKIEGVKLSEILQVINFRIEKILDRDHQIGHSYFLKIATIEALQQVFRDKIIPLLQEYFYGDYEKLGLILGNGFIGKNGLYDLGFASFSVEDPEIFERPVYEIKKDPLTSVDAFKSALKQLLNKEEK